MHATGGRIRHWFGSIKTSSKVDAAVVGTAIGLSIACVLSQIMVGLGMTPGVQAGLAAGLLLGTAWGHSQLRRQRADSFAAVWLSLAAVLLLWPLWMAVQLDAVRLLPTGLWDRTLTDDVVGFLLGAFTVSVPCGLWTVLLTRSSSPRMTCGSAAIAMVAIALFIAPSFGVFWPTMLGVLSVAVWKLCSLVPESSVPKEAGERPASPSGHRLNTLGMALFVGGFAAGWSGLASELFPQTPAIWVIEIAAVLGGVALSRVGRTSALVPLAMVGTALLLVSPWLIDAALWPSSRIMSPWLLETCRATWLIAIGLPLGWALGRVSASLSPLTTIGTFVGGLAVSAAALTQFADPLLLLATVTILAWLALLVSRLPQRQKTSNWMWSGYGAGLAACLAMIAAGQARWDSTRAGKLLFSTAALLGHRSGWEGPLLSQLDDIRQVHDRVGATGRWTIWQTRGGLWQLRRNGLPQGSLTTHPDWIPQYAPEVAVTVWPLVLVDQPARVLAVGAGSGAALQGALAFPIRELVCVEADDTLVSLIRGPLADACGFDPFADDRVRWRRHPAEWLAQREAELFDVIAVSSPPPVTTTSISTYSTTFYHRAASRLSQTGVFCQRFSGIDFGPKPLLTAAMALSEAFPATACLEVGVGEYLLLGAHSPAALARADLPQRLEMPHVVHVLSRCQWDWSLPLNFVAFDRNALREAAAELGIGPLSYGDCCLAFSAPRDLLRWGNKLQEINRLLTAARTSPPVLPLIEPDDAPTAPKPGARRASRYLDWIGPHAEDPELLRRLSEVAGARKLVTTYPDTCWWEYRKELREQLQDHPRTGIQPVAYSRQSPDKWHAEDRQRKGYFESLGDALKSDRPTPEQLSDVEAALEPYDPLVTLFGHQELAELYSRGDSNPARELAHRLHVIYYAPPGDCSVRNVVAAIDHLVAHPDAWPDDTTRYDGLNGLLQTLRSRWEGRTTRPSKSAKVTLQEIERSLLSVERAVETMEPLAITAGLSTDEWTARKTVLERILIRPFRGYREQLVKYTRESRRKTEELLQQGTKDDEAPAKLAQ